MKPDRIMLVDVTGKGLTSFDALLKNPAVADLPAVKEDRVKMYKGREVYALAETAE
jgi:iron complex transport system substrate-binding protein